MLQVQRYLRSGKTLSDLQQEFGIKVYQDQTYPELVCLKYDMVKSPMHRLLVQECRGLVLNQEHWSVVFRGFNKFFNYKEGETWKDINLQTAKVYKKLDGSFCGLYYYKGEWRVSTTGTSDGAGLCLNAGTSFADLFWSVFQKEGFSLPTQSSAKDFCFFFELMTPYNQVVVYHPTSWLRFLGGRIKSVGDYQPEYLPETLVDLFPETNWKVVESVSLTGQDFWSEAVDFTTSLCGNEEEGVVICDNNFNRAKLKNEDYVFYHHSLSRFSIRKAVDALVLKGETSEIKAYKPEYVPLFDTLEKAKQDLILLGRQVEKVRDSSDLSGRQKNSWWAEHKKDYPKNLQGFLKFVFFNRALESTEDILVHIYQNTPKRLYRYFRDSLDKDNPIVKYLILQEKELTTTSHGS